MVASITMKKIFESKFLKVTFFLYLLISIISVSATCYFFKLNKSVEPLSCPLIKFLLMSVSYAFLVLLTRIKKHKLIGVLIKSLILIPLILIPISIVLGSTFTNVYLMTDIFQNELMGPRTCADGRKIPCNKNSDCRWEKIVEYCGPFKVNPTMVYCAPSVKCSPEKICEDYCH